MTDLEAKTYQIDDAIISKLDGADWETIYPRVLRHAVYKCKRFNLLGTVKFNPEDFVQEAVACAYGCGEDQKFRNWNRERYPDLSDFLISIVDSLVNHKYEHIKKFKDDFLDCEDGLNCNLSTGADPLAESLFVSLTPLSPLDELERKERIIRCYEILQKTASGNEDMEMVKMCLEEGIVKAKEIATTTGIDIKKIYKILRYFRDKGKQYTKEFL